MNSNENKEFVQLLKQHDFFKLVSEDSMEVFVSQASIEEMHARQLIFTKGDKGSCMYFILKGSVKIHDGDHVFTTLEKGDFFGEYSLIDNHLRSASATTESRSTLLKLDREQFIAMMQTDDGFARGILHLIIARHREIDEIQYQLHVSKNKLLSLNNQLRGFLDGAMDAVIVFDNRFRIQVTNKAANDMLQNDEVLNRNLLLFLSEDSAEHIEHLVKQTIEDSTNVAVYIPRHITVLGSEGGEFNTEGTFSFWTADEGHQFSLILRNIEDKLKAEFEIQKLSEKAKNLERQIDVMSPNIGFIAEDKSMQPLIIKIEQVSQTDASVLIEGETGTGKELVAHAIHNHSKRKDGSFIKINCGAIPENLIESELFGHVKGAFTGASTNRTGRFELANNGTLFLDEIGELPLSLQPKFLRVLQEGEFEPVGSSKTIKVDVRIIAATHRDLFELVNKKEFREDLYYRLNVFPIKIPPLRDRGNDILLIANEFLKKYCKKLMRPNINLNEQDNAFLRTYHWPGNVRELQNIMERAAIISNNGQIDWTRLLPQGNLIETPKTDSENEILSQQDLYELEKNNLIKALKSVKWKISGKNGAAALLGIKPTTLASKIKAMGIERPN